MDFRSANFLRVLDFAERFHVLKAALEGLLPGSDLGYQVGRSLALGLQRPEFRGHLRFQPLGVFSDTWIVQQVVGVHGATLTPLRFKGLA